VCWPLAKFIYLNNYLKTIMKNESMSQSLFKHQKEN
jgi:hypothetical protein